jgi:hypothetical protein
VQRAECLLLHGSAPKRLAEALTANCVPIRITPVRMVPCLQSGFVQPQIACVVASTQSALLVSKNPGKSLAKSDQYNRTSERESIYVTNFNNVRRHIRKVDPTILGLLEFLRLPLVTNETAGPGYVACTPGDHIFSLEILIFVLDFGRIRNWFACSSKFCRFSASLLTIWSLEPDNTLPA